MKKSSTELYRDKLMELGIAMFSFLTGTELHPDQIMMIKEASDKQKVLALEMVAASYLKGKEYTNYCRNKRSIVSKK